METKRQAMKDYGDCLPFTEQTESERKFWEFHEENPHVYEKFRELSLQAKRLGRRRWGAMGILNRLRWFADFETTDPNWGSDFKINNNYAPHYARLLMKREPELRGFFELRELKAA